MIISLVGFRGSGKSSVALLLASELEMEFIDTDTEIEQREHRSIPEIFANQGEKQFRILEAAIIKSVYQRNDLIVATGGGAVLNPQTQKLIHDKGPVIWLQADAATTVGRIQKDQSDGLPRPALTDLSLEQEVIALLQQREPIYKSVSDFQIDTVGKSLEQIVEQIIQCLEGYDRSSE